jgi:hypothetical protein
VDAIGRYAASLALSLLDEQRATKLAVEHDLSSHLTSLLLVDEVGDAVEGLPKIRKLTLVRVETSLFALSGRADLPFASANMREPEARRMQLPYAESPEPSLAAGIDWDRLANAFLAGNLSGLTDAQREVVHRLARSEPVVALANAIGTDSLQTAIALLAETVQSRMAQRIARRLLRNAPPPLLEAAKAQTRWSLEAGYRRAASPFVPVYRNASTWSRFKRWAGRPRGKKHHLEDG